jgi:hypothetical protein
MQLIEHSDSPRYVRLHDDDNVVVVNDGGLGEGARFADGLTLVEGVPQSHKVATVDIQPGEPVRRYGQVIGYALEDLRQGSWVKEDQLACRPRPSWTACRAATPCRRPAAAGRLHLRGLPQRRRHRRHAQHPRHHHHRAVRDRRAGSRGQAHPPNCCPSTPTSMTWWR